jgi:hypothetical protein
MSFARDSCEGRGLNVVMAAVFQKSRADDAKPRLARYDVQIPLIKLQGAKALYN